MNQARDEERKARLAETDRLIRAKQKRTANIEGAKNGFYSLFGSSLTPQQRGKKLETAMNDLFRAYGVLVQESFHVVGDLGEGIVEQIDGVIELTGILYFVEMKWYKEPVGRGEISEHLVRLMSRAEARGIFISASSYTEPAIHACREFLQHKLIALTDLHEIVQILQREQVGFLLRKVKEAQIRKNPYFRPELSD